MLHTDLAQRMKQNINPPFNIKSEKAIGKFRAAILNHYSEHGRVLPWRSTDNPYYIFVSEFMLQQTQVERVLKKYGPFIEAFPDFLTLHNARLQRVLSVWQGLGYNRRCLYMKMCASLIQQRYNGWLPDSVETLIQLPGIGRSTASALVTFSYNKPTVFLETNIRTVFLHFFFPEKQKVSDSAILPLIERTLDVQNPRTWYYALMDYGTMLKSSMRNLNKRSTTYRKQSPFEGSKRQVRGKVLKILIAEPHLSAYEIALRVNNDPSKVRKILFELGTEGFIRKNGKMYRISE